MSIATNTRPGTFAAPDPEDSEPVQFVTIAIPREDYNDTLAAVAQRVADGEGTPVLASHLDALGLRGVIEDLAAGA